MRSAQFELFWRKWGAPIAFLTVGFLALAFFTSGISAPAVPEAPTTVVIPIDEVGDVGRYSAVAVAQDGSPVISYQDFTNPNSDLKLARCADPYCSTVSTITVESAGSVGWDTSLALTPAGLPVISHYDKINGDLRLAACSDPTCTAAITRTVATEGNVGTYSSIALKDGDIPVIAFYDEGDFDLELAVCNDSTCTSPFLTTLDSGGTVGWYASLALQADGSPVVSYYDATNGNLKLTICFDPMCATADKAGC